MNESDTDRFPVPDDPRGADSSGSVAPPGPDRPGAESKSRCEDDLRTRLAEKETLLREVHHRVKNDIAVLSAYLSLQANRLPDHSFERRTLLEARGRVEGMSRLYDRMSRAGDYGAVSAGAYLTELVEELRCLDPDPGRVEIRAELEDILLDSRKLFPLGMAVNELVVNAIKHAFPDGRKGTVRVILRLEADGAVTAGVEDDGVGMPRESDLREGLGRTLVPALASQIGGTLEELVPAGGGSAFRIRLPKGQGFRA